LQSSSKTKKDPLTISRELIIEGLISTSQVFLKKKGRIWGELITVSLGLRNCVAEFPISIIGVVTLLTGSTSVPCYVE
jgi:hypothetical protein